MKHFSRAIISTLFVAVFICCACSVVVAQDTEVEAKGIGLKRDDALQDALRNAVSQAAGVALTSETKVENFVVIQDAVSSRTSGYITSYSVIKETPFPDRYEVTVKAKVSMTPLKADINLLAKSVGGIRFMVMYDARNVKTEDADNYEYAIERVNEYLSGKKIRYIDKSRFDQLKKEAQGIMQTSETPEETYVQTLGLKADAQFIIFIKKIGLTTKSEAFDTRTSTKVTIEVKAYDNCTAEGLGTVVLESPFKSSQSGGIQAGIADALKNNLDTLMSVFNSYIGTWVNSGTPYELRFYSCGTYRDFRDLRTKLKADNDFGGDMEIVSMENFTKLNCTFKKKPDELADKILDYADQIEALKAKVLDVRFIYGRQINFAPQNVVVPELQEQQKNAGTGTETKPAADPGKGTATPKPTGKGTQTKPKTTPKPASTKKK
jgi:hypothetical protein